MLTAIASSVCNVIKKIETAVKTWPMRRCNVADAAFSCVRKPLQDKTQRAHRSHAVTLTLQRIIHCCLNIPGPANTWSRSSPLWSWEHVSGAVLTLGQVNKGRFVDKSSPERRPGKRTYLRPLPVSNELRSSWQIEHNNKLDLSCLLLTNVFAQVGVEGSAHEQAASISVQGVHAGSSAGNTGMQQHIVQYPSHLLRYATSTAHIVTVNHSQPYIVWQIHLKTDWWHE